jgi:predicted ATP-grasp superfamily ATP-dependent carboligase
MILANGQGNTVRDSADLQGVRVIVTDAETRLALYIIRALGRVGCRVTALTDEPGTSRVIGFASKYVADRHRIERKNYRETLVRTIERLADTHDVVLPISTLSIEIVAEHASSLSSKIRFFVPSLDTFRAANNKATTTSVAVKLGIPVPETHMNLDPTTIEAWARDTKKRFPLVVKFSDDRRETLWNPADRYRIVRSVEELAQEYARMCEVGDKPLVQEYIQGPGYGFFSLGGPSGEPLVTFCHKRLREYPTSGGPSTLCESVYDAKLINLGAKMVTSLKLRGVAMVEFKFDEHANEYKFLEVNPRFWGSLPLALRCGVNFPAYLVQMALGDTPHRPPDYPLGVKVRFLFSDLLAALDTWRNNKNLAFVRQYIGELLDLSIKDGLIQGDDLAPLGAYISRRLLR